MSALEDRLRAARPAPAEAPALDAAMRASARAILGAGVPRRRPRRRWTALGVAFVLAGGSAGAVVVLTGGEVLGRAPGEGTALGRLTVDGEVAAWIEARDGGSAVLAARRVDGAWEAPRLVGRGGSDLRLATVDGGGTVIVWASRRGVWSATLRPDGAVTPASRIPGFSGPAIKLDLSDAGDGTLVAGWEPEGGPKRAFLAIWRDGRWAPAMPLPNAPGGDGLQPSVAVGPDGTIAAAWQRLSRRGAEVRAAMRAPGGPWRRAVLARARSAGDQDVAFAADGRVLVTWAQRETDDAVGKVMIATGEPGSGWSRPVLVTRAGGSTPSVAALGAGAVLAWVGHDREDLETARLMAATVAPNGVAGRAAAVSGKGFTMTPALATDGEGRAALVWSDRAGETSAVLRVSWRRPDGSWSAPAAISDGTGYALFPSIALRGDGLRVAWIEIRAGETSVRAATVRR